MGGSKTQDQYETNKYLSYDSPSASVMFDASLGSQGGYKINNKLTDQQKAMVSAGQQKASQTIQNAPSYQEVGINSPQVQQIADTLNSNARKEANTLLNQDTQSSTANKERGSSFQALRQARLGDLLARQANENQLSSLGTALQTQAGNLSNASNAYGLFQGAGTYDPTLGYDPSALIAMGRGAYTYNPTMMSQMMDTTGKVASAVGSIAASDKNVKKNIKLIGTENGFNIYSFEYKTDEYPELPSGKQVGVIAQEVEEIIPSAVAEVTTDSGKYKVVDYLKLGVTLNGFEA